MPRSLHPGSVIPGGLVFDHVEVVGRLPGQGWSPEGLRVTVLLPANVSFPSSVRITQAKEAVDGLDLTWRRCISGGCLADAAAPEAVLKGWRGADEPGRIAFKDAAPHKPGADRRFEIRSQHGEVMEQRSDGAAWITGELGEHVVDVGFRRKLVRVPDHRRPVSKIRTK